MDQRLQQLLTQGGNIANYSIAISSLISMPDSFPPDILEESFHVMFDTIQQFNTNLREIQRDHIRQARIQQRRQRQLNNRPIVDLITTEQLVEIFGDDNDEHNVALQENAIVNEDTHDITPVIPRMKKPLSKIIKKTEFDAVIDDNCGICLDTKTRGETITTECGHNYCITCFDALVQFRKQQISRQNKVVHCPHCRSANPRITVYKMRKPRTQTPRIVPEDNTITAL